MGGEFHHEQVASTHVGFEMLQLGLALIDCCMVARYKKNYPFWETLLLVTSCQDGHLFRCGFKG